MANVLQPAWPHRETGALGSSSAGPRESGVTQAIAAHRGEAGLADPH